MYRTNLDSRDKGGAIAAVIVIHAALLFALLNISGTIEMVEEQADLEIFDVDQLDPPPPPPPPTERERPRPKLQEGGSAPKNIQSRATEVAAPTPRISLPVPVPINVTETPNQGSDPTQGASDVRGPGTGAGGTGTGTGSGSGGTGPGGGGDGGAVQPPRLASPVLRGRDFPRDMLDRWPRGAQIFLRLRVDARGFVGECTVDRGTGVAAIDSEICNLAHQRLRFRPALNRQGQAVAGWFGYRQTAPR